MIRKEAVLLPGPDPAGERKLAAFRAQIAALDADVASKTRRRDDFARTQASLVREHKFREAHVRMTAEDGAHRPSDRAFPIHALTAADRDLWQFQNVRAWYSGADATLQTSLHDTDAAQPSGAYYKQGDGNVPNHD